MQIRVQNKRKSIRKSIYVGDVSCRCLLSHGSSLQRDRSTSMYVHIHDQIDNATYALTGWVPMVREDKDALPCVQRYSWSVPAVRGRNHFYFASNKEALPCVRRCSWLVQLSASPRTVLFRWESFLDHVDHAAPRAPGRWTTVRPRKGTTRSRGRHGSGCPRREEYEGSLVRLRREAAVAAE